jgi:16S rRNA G966 N2-methylase RsmD
MSTAADLIDKNRLSDSWQQFYQAARDRSWPAVKTEQDVLSLPQEILRELMFEHAFLDNARGDPLRRLSAQEPRVPVKNLDYLQDRTEFECREIYRTKSIDVHYHARLDGGGTTFGQHYPRVINQIYPNRSFDSCFEWCSGPGFIGFDLLSRGYCQHLYLADIYWGAVKAIETTLAHNQDQCHDRVSVMQAARVADLPEHWRFDLVVSNPPHYNPDLGAMVTTQIPTGRRNLDPGWQIHQEFFASISRYLNPDAVILLQECSTASGPEMFRSMIEQNGLYIKDCYWEPGNQSWYYLEVKKQPA